MWSRLAHGVEENTAGWLAGWWLLVPKRSPMLTPHSISNPIPTSIPMSIPSASPISSAIPILINSESDSDCNSDSAPRGPRFRGHVYLRQARHKTFSTYIRGTYILVPYDFENTTMVGKKLLLLLLLKRVLRSCLSIVH